MEFWNVGLFSRSQCQTCRGKHGNCHDAGLGRHCCTGWQLLHDRGIVGQCRDGHECRAHQHVPTDRSQGVLHHFHAGKHGGGGLEQHGGAARLLENSHFTHQSPGCPDLAGRRHLSDGLLRCTDTFRHGLDDLEPAALLLLPHDDYDGPHPPGHNVPAGNPSLHDFHDAEHLEHRQCEDACEQPEQYELRGLFGVCIRFQHCEFDASAGGLDLRAGGSNDQCHGERERQ